MHAMVVQLQNEGITHPDDLMDFDKDMIKQIADNDPTPGAAAGATIPTPLRSQIDHAAHGGN